MTTWPSKLAMPTYRTSEADRYEWFDGTWSHEALMPSSREASDLYG